MEIAKPEFPELSLERMAEAINTLRDQPAVEVTEQMQRQEIYEFIMQDVHATTQKLLEVADNLLSIAGGHDIYSLLNTGEGDISVNILGDNALIEVENLRLIPYSKQIRIFPKIKKVQTREIYTPWHQYVMYPFDTYERAGRLRYANIVPQLGELAREYVFTKCQRYTIETTKHAFETYHLLPKLIVDAVCEGLRERNENEAKQIKALTTDVKGLLEAGGK
jgi:hypothetical protein